MRKYRALAAVLVTMLPVVMMACGDDDSPPPDDTGGSSGDAGDGSGGTAQGGRGGTGQGGRGGTGQGGDAGQDTGGAAGDGVGGAAGGDTGGSGGTGGMGDECDLSGDDRDHEEIPSDIEDDFTLTSDKVWELNGYVKVHDGAELTIEPCTRIEGSPAPDPGVLVVMRGGRINAAGTADAPILFTSASPPGTRATGQWGGVVILGRTPIGAPSASKLYEGLTDTDFTYGGDDPEDDSGVLQYARIEFGGFEILPEKEVNGLSMAAVGSGTTIDHIMVSNTSDDCFEWWGGSVEMDYLICNNPGDDMFDTDEGYLGGGNHWFGRRVRDDVISSADPAGFEWDGTEGGASGLLRTNVTLSNVTLCGTGVPSGQALPEFGMVLRELVTGEIDNLALLGFEYGIDTRNAFMAGDVTIEDSTFWELADGIGDVDTSGSTPDDDDGFDDASVFLDGTGNENPMSDLPFTLEDCLDENGPTAAVKDSDIGAFAGDADWMDGLWVDWSEN